ncbi:WSCD family member AAEL009094-like [Watersipora subatra]|uniref:WSCD family member AAEL009094-like n=1 Tax=Watersipora subatra TaxID=2589382 RepID=UPI00355B756C
MVTVIESTLERREAGGRERRIALKSKVSHSFQNATTAKAAKDDGKLGEELSCDDLEEPTFFPPNVHPLTALTSFPGSGNTWTRLIITSATGIITGDVYKDGSFRAVKEFSFRHDDTAVAIKTHHPFLDDNNGPDPLAPARRYWERAIILVRHPLDATIAVFNFGQSKASHTRKADIKLFIDSDGKATAKWNKYAHDQIRNWARCLRYWINTFKGPKLIIFYENLLSNMQETLIDIHLFLGLEVNQKRLHCTVESNKHQRFHRRDHHDKRLLYDASMLEEAEKALEDIQNLISANYTHIRPGFRLPPNYAPSLIKRDFSIAP